MHIIYTSSPTSNPPYIILRIAFNCAHIFTCTLCIWVCVSVYVSPAFMTYCLFLLAPMYTRTLHAIAVSSNWIVRWSGLRPFIYFYRTFYNFTFSLFSIPPHSLLCRSLPKCSVFISMCKCAIWICVTTVSISLYSFSSLFFQFVDAFAFKCTLNMTKFVCLFHTSVVLNGTLCPSWTDHIHTRLSIEHFLYSMVLWFKKPNPLFAVL